MQESTNSANQLSIHNINKTEVEETMKIAGISRVSIAAVDPSVGKNPISMPIGAGVTEETTFGAASLSKPVFAYLVLKLIEAGEYPFNLDKPLCEILPLDEAFPGLISEDMPEDYKKALTARMVLSHQTGLDINEFKFNFAPGSGEYGYSNIAILYLQKLIEKLTQSNLEALAKKYVFDEIGMDNSSFILADKSKPKEAHEAMAAYSLYTTATDYGKFVAYWMNDEKMQEAFESKISMMKDNKINDKWAEAVGVSKNDLKYLHWGLGWGLQIDDQDKSKVIAYHSGDSNEWRAYVAMDIDKKTAIVYFAKSNSVGIENNGLVLADQIISPNGQLKHALNCLSIKFGFAVKIENNWEALQKARFEDIPKCLALLPKHVPESKENIEITQLSGSSSYSNVASALNANQTSQPSSIEPVQQEPKQSEEKEEKEAKAAKADKKSTTVGVQENITTSQIEMPLSQAVVNNLSSPRK